MYRYKYIFFLYIYVCVTFKVHKEKYYGNACEKIKAYPLTDCTISPSKEDEVKAGARQWLPATSHQPPASVWGVSL